MNYNDLPGLRWSRLSTGLQSAKHLQARIAEQDEDSTAKRFGRGLHMAVFEPDRFEIDRHLVPDEFVTKTGISTGAKCAAWLATLPPDPIVVTMEERDRMMRMREAIEAHDDAGEWLRRADRREEVKQWVEHIDGIKVQCKRKIDAAVSKWGLLWDLKSFGAKTKFGIRACMNEIAARNYHAQLGFYDRAESKPFDMFGLVFVESKAPHDVIVFQATEDDMACGREDAERALLVYVAAQATGKWPGVAPSKVVGMLPAYMFHADDGDVAAELGLEGMGDE